MFRKNCALALSMLLMLSSLFPASVYANTLDEGSRSVLTVSEVEKKLVEDHQDAQEKDVSEVKTTVEKVAFHEERILDGIRISVSADAGVFPKGSVLKAKKLVKKADKKKVEASIEEKLKEEDATLAESFIFDISIRDKDGEEIQPDTSQGEVKVSFEQLDLSALQEGKELAVFHLDEVEAEAEKLADIEIKHDEETVEVTAEHFSVFVVSFINKADKGVKSVGMIADNSLMLKDLFGEDNPFNGDFSEVQAVSSDHEDIVSVSKNDEGEVLLKALKEGEAMISVTPNSGDVKNFRIIVQKPYDQGRIGENMVYVVSGEEGKMTLTIKGYGLSDDQARVPWFPYRDQIQKVIIEKNVESLSIESAFAEMKNLEEVSLPSTLVDIPSQAFYHSDKLKDVTIPASVESIGSQAFVKQKGSGTKNVIFNRSSDFLEEDYDYKAEFTTVQQAAKKEANHSENNKGKGETKKESKIDNFSLYIAPGGIKYLELTYTGDSTLKYYLYKSTVDEGTAEEAYNNNKDNFKPLNGEGTYSKNKGVNYIRADDTDWVNGQTYYCYLISKEKKKNVPVELFKKIITVGDPSTILPNTDANNLTWEVTEEPTVPPNDKTYKLRISGTGEIPDSFQYERPWNKLFATLDDDSLVKLDISNGITKIGSSAFHTIEKYKGNLDLPDSITEIAEFSFRNATIDGNIHFPASLKKIGDGAFKEANFSGDVVLPEGLQSIGEDAFRVDQVGNITIPSTVKEIGIGAFYKYEMGLEGKNTITNNSGVKLNDRHANPLFTNFEREDPAKTNLNPPRRGGGGSGSGGGSSSGGGGGSSSGGGGGSGMKLSTGNGSTSSAPVNWQKDDKGWWVRNSDGSYPKNEWKQVNNNWYFFNGEGYMATGWVAVNDAWYYMEATEGSNSGIMTTGWKLLNDTWYFLSQEAGANNGKMLAGWQLINGKWYYFSTEAGANYGKMLANTVVDGYALGADGAWNDPAQKNA